VSVAEVVQHLQINEIPQAPSMALSRVMPEHSMQS
jgi:hypothetical protein